LRLDGNRRTEFRDDAFFGFGADACGGAGSQGRWGWRRSARLAAPRSAAARLPKADAIRVEFQRRLGLPMRAIAMGRNPAARAC